MAVDQAFRWRLTARERQVLWLVAEGLRDDDIARALKKTHRTVRFHVSNLFRKADARSRMELVNRARRVGWLD